MTKNKIIKEICIKLGLKIEIINDVIIYSHTFTKSKSHSFSEEVVVASSIYLSCKVNEDFRRIRDIINVIYFVKSKYNFIEKHIDDSNTSNDDKKLYENLINDNYNDERNLTLIKTMHYLTIENYYILRDEILKAEQFLLRLINYSFDSHAKEIYLMICNYADYLEFDCALIQLSLNILNFCYENNPEIIQNNTEDKIIILAILNIVLELQTSFNKNEKNDLLEKLGNMYKDKEKIDRIAQQILKEILILK